MWRWWRVQYCPVLMLNNEPHTADNGYYCVHTARVDIPVSSLQRFNFRNTRSAGSPRSPSSYLESCFVMEMSDEADELDPLDAYMTEVSKEVRKIKGGMNMKNSKIFKKPGAQAVKDEGKKAHFDKNHISSFNLGNGEASAKKKGLVIMTGVAKKKPEVKSVKPEVMEQNQDGLEYSSEEDVDVDELKDKLKEKGKKELVKIDHASIQYESFR